MKHVFIIHGHTLFLTALGVINQLSLDMEDVIFLYARNYRNSIYNPDCKTIDISPLYKSLQTGKKILMNRKYRTNKIREVDELIETHIGYKYILYVPHFAFALFQLFYTNNLCCKACYIQEGGIPFKKAYSTKFPLYKRIGYGLFNHIVLRDGRLKIPRKWFIKGFLNKQTTLEAFAISDSFFRHLPAEVHHVKWPVFNIDITIAPQSTVFVFDGFVSNHHIEKDFYERKCRKLVEREARNCNYIKYHPMQSNEERKLIMSYFPKNVIVKVLDDSVPFEVVLSSFSHLTIVGFDSSLLYFAEDLGHNVHAYREWLYESPLFLKFKNNNY